MPKLSRIAIARQLNRFAFALSVWLLISSRFSYVFAKPSSFTTEHLQRRNDDDDDDYGAAGGDRRRGTVDETDDDDDDDGVNENTNGEVAAVVEHAADPNDDFEFENDKFSNRVVDRDEQRIRNSVSEHELPKTIPTRLKIVGDLATPAPESGIRLEFVPKQTYVQVRRYDEQIHLPRSAAYADAETQEELLNAPRLREVVTQKKTQEVYEEQGYEDAAYDHGGYKKAGEKHENKYMALPSKEAKTDYEYVFTTDRSPSERGSPTNLAPRYNATNTNSSHTTAKNSVLRPGSNRRAKRPKSRTPSLRRTGEKTSTRAESTTKSPPPLSSSTSVHPPRSARVYAKSNSSTRSDEPKQMEESKFHTTMQPLTQLDIEPITYRPIPPKTLVSKLKQLRSMQKQSPPPPPIKVPLVGDDGYKFENPFEFNDLETISKVQTSIRTRYAGLHDKENTYQRIPVYTIQDDGGKARVRKNKRPPTKKPVANEFPYEIIGPNKSQLESTNGRKRVKIVFPYKIVDNSAYKTTPLYSAKIKNRATLSPVPEMYSRVEFGEPDTSPWIPITPKVEPTDSIYKIHGYEGKQSKSVEIKVKENDGDNDDDASSTAKLKLRFSPIRVYDLPKQTISTSYTIQHVYPNVRQPSLYQPTHGNELPYDLQDTAESMHPYSSGRFKPYQLLGASNRINASTIKRDQTASATYDFVTTGYTASDLQKDQIASSITTGIATTTTTAASTTNDDIIETMSSNRYSVFQRYNQTTTPATEISNTVTLASDELERLFMNAERDKFMFRHPHLSRDTSRFVKSSQTSLTEDRSAAVVSTAVATAPVVATTTAASLKRDIIVSSVKNGSITQLTKVAKRNDIAYQKPILVYPQDYMSSAKYVEKLTLAHFSFPENVVHNPLPLGYRDRMANLADHLRNNTSRIKRDTRDEDEKMLKISLGGTTTEISVNLSKYPFYTAAPSDSLSKYSALRYASNPRHTPRKRAGKMSFYESRNNVQCVEPSPPKNIVPKRVEGQWAYDPRPRMPRISLGDKISCLKVKFFGADPLDNPFFKEDLVGFPEIQQPKKLPSIEEVSSQQDFEMLPKKSSNLRKREITRSPIRKWIDSLATTAVPLNVNKRSPKEQFDRRIEERAKQASKILYVGGFLNRENLTENKNKRPAPSLQKYLYNTDVPAYQVHEPTQRPIVSSSTAISTTTVDDENKNEELDINSFQDNFGDYEAELSREITKIKPKYSNGEYAAATKFENNIRARPATSSSRFQLYQQPTWRVKNNFQIISTTPATTAKSVKPLLRDIDSLLYVIHPKTGEGKWMKIMKVEDADHIAPPEDSTSLGDETPLNSVLYRPDYTRFEDDHKMPCKQNENDSEKSYSSEYDVYHISGLLRQVAPLKGNEMEINSLQTTNENIEDERDGDNVLESYSGINQKDESEKKSEQDLQKRANKQFPQPHERLYYYVVDDEETERK